MSTSPTFTSAEGLAAWRAYFCAAAAGLVGEYHNSTVALVEHCTEVANLAYANEIALTAELQEFIAAKARGATASCIEEYRSACRQLEQMGADLASFNTERAARLERTVGA